MIVGRLHPGVRDSCESYSPRAVRRVPATACAGRHDLLCLAMASALEMGMNVPLVSFVNFCEALEMLQVVELTQLGFCQPVGA